MRRMPTPASTTPSQIDATSPAHASAGRLALLTGFAAAASALPVPILPDQALGRIRGAIAHDVATRHGVSLTAEARDVLASAGAADRALGIRAIELALTTVLRRLGPLGATVSIARGLEAYALGHLLARYFTGHRREKTVRIQGDEARQIRSLIDRAVVRAISPALRPTAALLPGPVEDLRDEWTRWMDTLLLAGAALPGYVDRRLDAAFDEVLAESEGRVG